MGFTCVQEFVCVCVVFDAGKLVNTQLAVPFDTLGDLEDISHFLVLVFSSPNIHYFPPSFINYTKSTHPQLWSEGWRTFFLSRPAKLFVFTHICVYACAVSWCKSLMDVNTWMCVCIHFPSHLIHSFTCEVWLITFSPNTGETAA